MKNEILNWFGMSFHYTDSFVYWNDEDPKETAKKLRKAWDSLVHNEEEADKMKILLNAARMSAIKEMESENDF
jgi:hypothetical protein